MGPSLGPRWVTATATGDNAHHELSHFLQSTDDNQIDNPHITPHYIIARDAGWLLGLGHRHQVTTISEVRGWFGNTQVTEKALSHNKPPGTYIENMQLHNRGIVGSTYKQNRLQFHLQLQGQQGLELWLESLTLVQNVKIMNLSLIRSPSLSTLWFLLLRKTVTMRVIRILLVVWWF